MSQSLFAILRRRLVIVGLALTAASFAVVSFYYADWAAMRAEKLDEQVERIASLLQRDAAGKLTASVSSRHKELFDQYPKAYAYRVEDRNGLVISEANAALIPSGLTSASLPDSLVKATFGSPAPDNTLTTIHRVSVAGAPAYVTFASTSDPAGLTWHIFSGEIVGHVVAPILPFALILTIINLWTIKKSLAPSPPLQPPRIESGICLDLNRFLTGAYRRKSRLSCKRQTRLSNGWDERWKPSAPSPRKWPMPCGRRLPFSRRGSTRCRRQAISV